MNDSLAGIMYPADWNSNSHDWNSNNVHLSPKNDPDEFEAKVREIQLENGWEE